MELDGAQYLGFNLPFSISQLVWIEALLVGGAEVYRNGATDLEERIYPGARAPPARADAHEHSRPASCSSPGAALGRPGARAPALHPAPLQQRLRALAWACRRLF